MCLIRVEVEGPGSVLLSVLTSHDLAGRVLDQWRLTDPAEVLPLVQAFLDRSIPSRFP
ncbi:hypothetical protein [Nocardioides flavus (ex Wang et al. 2016)]|uniref:hypothetical protein n=1 Tax=Nocardioides flavus (ex Wang et al. 2016) TaxID=2058780 RepID=UPI00174CC0CE|nr:hypothetical protein [Nocardioides flavus (ex Wang et al. 2016)]